MDYMYFYPDQVDQSICQLTGVWFSVKVSFYFIFRGHTQLSYTNSEDPDQMPNLVAADLGLQPLPFLGRCALMGLKWSDV